MHPHTRRWLLPRRTVLTGLGAALALPLLETMGWADPPRGPGGAYRPPVRLAFIYEPNGVIPEHFWPKDGKFGQGAPLPSSLEPLRPYLGDTLILGGLGHKNASGDAAGTHAREAGTYLTGVRIAINAVRAAISVDQAIAQKIGAYTALPSLELGTMPAPAAGDCTPGYSCAYFNLSWRSATQPMPKEINPRAVLERLFSSRRSRPARRPAVAGAADAKTVAASADAPAGPSLDQSMIDIVLDSAKKLRERISGSDQRKLDEYLDGMRSLESRIQAIEKQSTDQAQNAAAKRAYKSSPLIEVKATAIPEKFHEHVQLLMDLIILAFQSDSTRISTFMMGQMFRARGFPEIGISDDHHSLSHHFNKPEAMEKLRRIDAYYMEQFAYMIKRMKGLSEGPGTLLDNCMVVYGAGLGNGFSHSPVNLPTIIAGTGGGTIRPGRYVPTCNGNFSDLLIGLAARMGVELPTFGDGTKALPDLS
ncbi:MAG: DUF1552 domain-containing protein [Planctomycetes bacterium]|nr:DUF1552 domain-containing protein [Planctomycetota bacterium]